MVNLVAGRRVVPELIQDEFTPEAAARQALAVLTDPAHAARREARPRRACARKLGTAGASRRAAEAVARRRLVAAGSRNRLDRCAVSHAVALLLVRLGRAPQATVLIPIEFRELVAVSPVIVHGRVVDVAVDGWTGAARSRPS